VNVLRRTAENRFVAIDYDGTLDSPWMSGESLDQCFFIKGSQINAFFLGFFLSHDFGGCFAQFGKDVLQGFCARGRFQIFNNLWADALFFDQGKSLAGFTAAGIVINDNAHEFGPVGWVEK